MHTVRRQFEGVGPIGTMITPNGERNLMAGYSADSERRRYIALSLGPNQISDFDGRDQNPVEMARIINLKAEQYDDDRRERQGLRLEERRCGKEGGSRWRSRWSTYH